MTTVEKTDNFFTVFAAFYLGKEYERNALFILLNAYFGQKPVSAERRKGHTISSFIDDNGKLLPLTIAAIELFLETPEAKVDPVIAKVQADAEKAKAAAEAERKEEGNLFSTQRKAILRNIRQNLTNGALDGFEAGQQTFQNIWTAYWTGAAQYTYAATGKVMSLTPDYRLVMSQLVAEGIAPTPTQLGLGEPPLLYKGRFPLKGGFKKAASMARQLVEYLPPTWKVTRSGLEVTVHGWPTMGAAAARMATMVGSL